MHSLRDFQNSFGSAVRGAPTVLYDLHAAAPISLESRIDVYRNNVHASLIDGLERAFPVVLQLVGQEFFRAMSREYLHDHMPTRGTLIGFGSEMPDFLDRFPPVSSLPYLGGVARLELAWLRAYHAEDMSVVTADELAGISQEEFSDLHFELHPSVGVLQSQYPILSIWLAHQPGGKPASVNLEQGGETVLLIRPDLTVKLHAVTEGARAFVDALRSQEDLGTAVEAALQAQADFDLSNILHLFLSGGGFARITRSQRMD